MYDVRASSLEIQTRLVGFGLSPMVQQRLGAFAIVWGLFETNLETTLWALRQENVKGERPSTDSKSISDWIKELDANWPQLPTGARPIMADASHAAFDLMDYRHAIFHGTMVPLGGDPVFIRNPLWNGEKRKRITHDAHIDENLLDLAIDTGWTLFRLMRTTAKACEDVTKVAEVLAFAVPVRRARGHANELRHLTALMNDDKY
ncbi:hypothetical protein NKI25_33105 [Mesorhizobium sp. M0808]|uniref:hypothetical protein n=1 Tax=Mesorhizobium sp. M0808 TaxID=2957002 RepID=UPI003335559A